MVDFSKLSDIEFDKILMSILSETKASEMISVPGFYEIASEEFNNEVLNRWEQEQGDEEN